MVHMPGSGLATMTMRCARKFDRSVTLSPLAGGPDGPTIWATCRHCTEIEKITLSTDGSIGTWNSCIPGLRAPASLKIVWGCDPMAVRRVAESPISSGASSSR